MRFQNFFSHNTDVERINDRHLCVLEDEPRSFDMLTQGNDKLIDTLKRGCLSPEKLLLKPGAVVMFTKNNMNQGFVNGTLGEVVGFDDDTSYPIVRTKSGDMIEASPMEWTIEENGKIKAKISQIPLRLAWAITIHKSQGMSMDAALIDLTQVFEYGQGYVALSRVKRLSGLYLLGSNEKAFQVHPQVLKKDTEFRLLSDQACQVFAKIDETELSKMHNNFIITCGGTISPKSDLGEGEGGGRKRKRFRKDSINKGLTTYEQTHHLLKEGKTSDEIAALRGLTRETIISHFCKLFDGGVIEDTILEKELSHTALEDRDDIVDALRQDTESGKLTPIFEKFEGRYSYNDLRIIRALSK